MSSYRYSSAAHADIEAITLYIFDLNPVAAGRFLDVLEETSELLATHPFIGRHDQNLAKACDRFPLAII